MGTAKPPAARTALLLTSAGAALLALGIWGRAADVVWISQSFYIYAWWAWILLLDGFCVWRRRSSLLTTRRHLLGLLATSSVTFWFVFEALNLRFANWYYVGTFELDGLETYVGAGLFTAAAFSTVFIGMFEVFDALGAANVLTHSKDKAPTPRALPSWLPGALQLLGLAMALAAIVFPFYLAPLIWGSLTFLIDPWNYRRGNRSLLRDFEAGDGRAVARLFLAGLISGLVWESLNFIAPMKWIYTVRGLENLKLFEMPMLGFLGFPALAFDAVTAFSLMSYFLCGNRAWEHPSDLVAKSHAATDFDMRRYWRTLPLQVLFWIGTTIALMPISIGSIRLRLERVPLVATDAHQLEAMSIRWPRQLQAALEEPARAADLARQLKWTPDQTSAVRDELDLYLFKGIGSTFGDLLEQQGIRRVDDLATQDPTKLHLALVQLAAEVGIKPPRLDWVRVWVLASRSHGVLLRNDR